MPGSIVKAQIRRRIWDALTRAGIAGFPGAHGRTPTFAAAGEAVEHLRAHAAWRQARRVLVLSEPVLKAVRRAVVADGKTLVVPDLARTTGWIVEIDPARMEPAAALAVAASFDAACVELPAGVRCLYGRQTEPVDLMVVGAVCVDPRGTRVGKGTGEADIVYALGRSRHFLGEETPVAVIVHDMQVCEEPGARESTDLPIDLISTPRGIQEVRGLHIRPSYLDPVVVTPERLALFPGLAGVLEREGIAPPVPQQPRSSQTPQSSRTPRFPQIPQSSQAPRSPQAPGPAEPPPSTPS
jgi:5-formyltetrahydrofolate cyclo-ligase